MRRQIDYEIMPSGAGHDAMQMAKITPAGMIFIPSQRGISHNPLEWTDPDDIGLGAQLLMETMIRVANENFSQVESIEFRVAKAQCESTSYHVHAPCAFG